MLCYSEGCDDSATHELRGFRMCSAHYIEALEHGADLGFNVLVPAIVSIEASKLIRPCSANDIEERRGTRWGCKA